MATNTVLETTTGPTDLTIETAGTDTVLAVRFEDTRSARDARRLAEGITVLRMPGVEGVHAVGDRVVISFDPATMTRSHLELLVRDTAQHI
jgi:hypothetical protein